MLPLPAQALQSRLSRAKPRFSFLRLSSEIKGGATAAAASAELQDFSNEATGLFNNVRIPAALFAGASAGATFALPLVASEGLKVGMVKRIYALMMMGALSSEVVAVVVSTLTMGALSTQSKKRTAVSLHDFLLNYYELEWSSTRLHFLSGVLLFSLAIGMRAWISISCPVVAKAALGIILSSTLLCLSFWRQLEGDSFMDGVVQLPARYAGALIRRSKQSEFFAASFTLTLVTALYIIMSIPHVAKYLLAAH